MVVQTVEGPRAPAVKVWRYCFRMESYYFGGRGSCCRLCEKEEEEEEGLFKKNAVN